MLRDYQRRLLAQVNEALAETNSVVMQMPTGAGKTITAAEMIRTEAAKGPVWFVCHRREIIRQASHTLSNLGVRHDVIAPRPDKMNLGFGYTPGAKVSIASVQTLARRSMDEAPRLIIWDECHHAAAETWSSIINSLPDTKHVGLTATPERTDGRGLKEWFSSLVCGPSISDLIEQGHLARLRVFAPTVPDMSAARLAMGDYRTVDAEKAMNLPVLIGNAVDEYQRHAPGSRAILFATSREASKAAADRFNAAGIPAQHVDALTSVDERDAAIQSLGSGRLRVLTNVEVFTEGVDVPGIETVILMRPTKSLTLYLQMIGRGMRVTDESDVLTVFDHSGNLYEHGIPDAEEWMWSIDGGAKRRRQEASLQKGKVVRRCPQCSHSHPIAPTCGECGYEYPSGREVGEFDGILRPASRRYMALQPAARMLGYSQLVRLNNFSDAPIDRIGGRFFVDPKELLSWLEANGFRPNGPRGWSFRELAAEDLNSAVPIEVFSSEVGKSRGWVRKHLPEDYMRSSGNRIFVLKQASISWLNDQADRRGYSSLRKQYGGPKEPEKLRRFGLLPCRDGMYSEREYVRVLARWEGSEATVRSREIAARAKVPMPAPGRVPDGFLAVADAARITGLSGNSLRRAISKGCPATPEGFPKTEALQWLDVNWHPHNAPPRDVDSPSDYAPISRAAKALSVKPSTLKKLVAEGRVQVARNGWVNETQMRAEIEKRSLARLAGRVKTQGVLDGEMYATKWAAGRGHTYGALKRMLEAGLPHRTSGASKRPHIFVEEGAADLWVREKWDKPSSSSRPPDDGDEETYLSGTRFCLLFSSSVKQAGKKLTDLKRRGLPTAGNGWVHVRSGLEWVRDNTAIPIPPEAWPNHDDAAKIAAE